MRAASGTRLGSKAQKKSLQIKGLVPDTLDLQKAGELSVRLDRSQAQVQLEDYLGLCQLF